MNDYSNLVEKNQQMYVDETMYRPDELSPVEPDNVEVLGLRKSLEKKKSNRNEIRDIYPGFNGINLVGETQPMILDHQVHSNDPVEYREVQDWSLYHDPKIDDDDDHQN